MNAMILKLIAMITMAVDHTGMVFLHNESIYRFIGRIAFPLYAFMIAEGYAQTKKTGRTMQYWLRLLLTAIISELPYDMSLYTKVQDLTHSNVVITLLIGLTMIMLMGLTDNFFLKLLPIAPACYLADYLHSSYGHIGILVIAGYCLYVTYMMDKPWYIRLAWLSMMMILFGGYYIVHNARSHDLSVILASVQKRNWLQTGVLLTVPMILFYNGQKGPSPAWFKWTYRFFYPLHLAVIAAIRWLPAYM